LVVVLQARGVSLGDTFQIRTPNRSTVEIRRTLLWLFQRQSHQSKYFQAGYIALVFSSASLIFVGIVWFLRVVRQIIETRIIAQSTFVVRAPCKVLWCCVMLSVCRQRFIGSHEYSCARQSSKSAKSRWLQQWQFKVSNLQHNKALHPTAYSSVPFARASLRSLRFRRRVSLVVVLMRAAWLRVIQ